MNNTVVIDGDVELNIVIDGNADLQLQGNPEFGIVTAIEQRTLPIYSGPVTITPGAETITLATTETIVEQDIVINKIPDNYGLITWNGSTLTVS